VRRRTRAHRPARAIVILAAASQRHLRIATMSYSMSPPQKPAPRPYSPYQNAGSPTNAAPYGGPPPAKRQRMSPDPRSPPNGTPTHAQPSHGYPNVGSYGNPYAQQQALSQYGTPGGYATSPQSGFNTPQPYPYQSMPWQSQPGTPISAGGPVQQGIRQNSPQQPPPREMMPPPPRPNKDDREEKVGFEDLGDSLFGSGINLKDEENYMYTMYNNRQNESFTTNQNTSFGSSTTMSGNNSFNLLTQGTSFGSQDAFAGTMNRPMSQEDIEVEHRRKREAAAKALSEKRQHHLNNQFLLGNNVRKRVDRLAMDQGVTVNMQGVFVRQQNTNIMMNGDGREGVAAVEDVVNGVKQDDRPESVVNQNTPFEHLASLISLAAGERLRGLLGEAYTLARARRYGDHGRVVPLDFADIATGEGKSTEETVVPASITGSQWDKAPNPNPNASDSATPQPQHTLNFQGTLNVQLRTLAEQDKEAEAARLKKREARRRAAEATANGDTTTPTDVDSAAVDAAAALKLTKKEIAKQAKEKNSSTEAQLHRTTNQTAAMMALGKKGNRFSWMQGGVASMPTNKYAKPPSGTATPGAPATAAESGGPTTPGATAMVKTGSANGVAKAPEWGDWTEEGSPGVEMRDWVLVLERDGKEKRALEKAMIALR